MLGWSKQFSIFCFLDNSGYNIHPHAFEAVLAAGTRDHLLAHDLEGVDDFLARHNSTVFGHLSYELKNSIHGLRSSKPDPIGFPPLFFFVPEVVIRLRANEVEITAADPEQVYASLLSQSIEHIVPDKIEIQQKLTREQYLEKIEALKTHILRGDCYEINFCQEFFAEGAVIDPAAVFEKLVELSPNPFSALYRLDQRYLICASPERFAVRTGQQIFSQPMKGTMARDLRSDSNDALLKSALSKSEKERSENVMVVDLVRNDLTKICEAGTVRVDELFGVYSYPNVHQMISTVSGKLKADSSFTKIIRALYPMGSMTGAPKYRVMELIEEYEPSARGIFSGSVGYIHANGDFDFNVVIRSMMYNAASRYLSWQVGSGITFYSDAEKEWEECLLKAAAMIKVVQKGA